MLSFFSSRRNWDSQPPPAGECAPHRLVPGGGAHSLARERVRESQFRRGDIHCGTLYIYVCTLWLVPLVLSSPCCGIGGHATNRLEDGFHSELVGAMACDKTKEARIINFILEFFGSIETPMQDLEKRYIHRTPGRQGAPA